MASALAWVLNLLGGWRQRRGERNEGDKLQMRASDRRGGHSGESKRSRSKGQGRLQWEISANFFKGTGVTYLRPARRSGPLSLQFLAKF